jgi:hypothetical protein
MIGNSFNSKKHISMVLIPDILAFLSLSDFSAGVIGIVIF